MELSNPRHLRGPGAVPFQPIRFLAEAIAPGLRAPEASCPRRLFGESMCDFPEEELAEYLLWLEVARARARTVPARIQSERPSAVPSVPERSEPATAEA